MAQSRYLDIDINWGGRENSQPSKKCGLIKVILFPVESEEISFEKRKQIFLKSFNQKNLSRSVVELSEDKSFSIYFCYEPKEWPNLSSFNTENGKARIEIYPNVLPLDHWQKIDYYPGLSIYDTVISYCDDWLLEEIREVSDSVDWISENSLSNEDVEAIEEKRTNTKLDNNEIEVYRT